jgi:Na+-transporting methylmalonyl-CoA/oxaloacetate decarboxylase gamma subunit
VETTLQAVNITVAGMGLIFFALALVMVAMVGLDRLFPGEARSPGGPSQPTPPVPPTAVRLQAVVGEKTFLLEAKGGTARRASSQWGSGSSRWSAASRPRARC